MCCLALTGYRLLFQWPKAGTPSREGQLAQPIAMRQALPSSPLQGSCEQRQDKGMEEMTARIEGTIAGILQKADLTTQRLQASSVRHSRKFNKRWKSLSNADLVN